MNDANFSKRISIGKWTEVSHLVLMTDGVSDPRFETDNGLQNSQKWDDLIAELAPCLSDPSQPAERLAEWLNFFSPEITFALPDYPQYEVALRYMHRSGIFGTYNGVYEGANTFAVGFRYRF